MARDPHAHHRHVVTHTDTRRAESFSDAVLAIIITILVLDLQPPESRSGGLLRSLLAQWPAYLAYLTSYLYVAVGWLNHTATFARLRHMDRRLQWANLLVLFTTGLLPFSTAVIAGEATHGSAADMKVAVVLYGLVGVLLCAAWAILFAYLRRHHELLHESVNPHFFSHERRRALVGLALYVVAAAIGYFVLPAVAMAIFFGLAVFYGVTSHGVRARHPRRDDAPRPGEPSPA